MITLFRMIRLWQLRMKWRFMLWQFIDKQTMELIKNPEKIEKKILPYLSEFIHSANQE